MTSLWLFLRAIISGVIAKEASQFTSIRLRSKMYSTASALPVDPATCRIVWPILSTRLTSAPRDTMHFAAFRFPCFTASWRGEEPEESRAFRRFAFDATSKLIALSWPWNAASIKDRNKSKCREKGMNGNE